MCSTRWPFIAFIWLFAISQVKLQTWIGNNEGNEFVGVGARFGPPIVSKEKHANRSQLAISDPPDCCTTPKNKVLCLASRLYSIEMQIIFLFLNHMFII